MDKRDLEKFIINLLHKSGKRYTLAYFSDMLKKEHRLSMCGIDTYTYEVLWDMLSRGLMFVDMGCQSSFENAQLTLTEKGRALADNASINPDDPIGYVEKINSKLPHISEEEMIYLNEAVYCYEAKRYLAAVVMLGVVFEKAYLDLVDAFLSWPKSNIGGSKIKKLTEPRTAYSEKKRILVELLNEHKQDIDKELWDGFDEIMTGISGIIRLTRNDAGHPKGVDIKPERAFELLTIAPISLERLHKLKVYFQS